MPTTRRSMLFALGATLAPALLRAQEAKRPLIGFLAGGSRAGDAALLAAFWRRMNELGYIEGRNIAAEYRFADGALERLPEFAAVDAVRPQRAQRPQLIVGVLELGRDLEGGSPGIGRLLDARDGVHLQAA